MQVIDSLFTVVQHGPEFGMIRGNLNESEDQMTNGVIVFLNLSLMKDLKILVDKHDVRFIKLPGTRITVEGLQRLIDDDFADELEAAEQDVTLTAKSRLRKIFKKINDDRDEYLAKYHEYRKEKSSAQELSHITKYVGGPAEWKKFEARHTRADIKPASFSEDEDEMNLDPTVITDYRSVKVRGAVEQLRAEFAYFEEKLKSLDFTNDFQAKIGELLRELDMPSHYASILSVIE